VDVVNGGHISSSTFSDGKAGNVLVTAKTLTIDKGSSTKDTGIFSTSEEGGIGNAGDINLTTDVLIIDGGLVASNTHTSGTAGTVTVNSSSVDIMNGGQITSFTKAEGNAGSVNVTTTTLKIANGAAGIFSSSEAETSRGNAGTVTINSSSLELLNNGIISTRTYGLGDAGEVNVTANTLKIDGQNSLFYTGIHSGALETSHGKAGVVTVNAHTLDILNQGAISSDTQSLSTGDMGKAGNLFITATEKITLDNQGAISSSTFSKGNAGAVIVTAPIISINNASIYAAANVNSSGQTGDVVVTASKNLFLTNQAKVSIENDATVLDPTAIKAIRIKLTR
jgi:large exoprotein involved in heme utilization and adhesion